MLAYCSYLPLLGKFVNVSDPFDGIMRLTHGATFIFNFTQTSCLDLQPWQYPQDIHTDILKKHIIGLGLEFIVPQVSCLA